MLERWSVRGGCRRTPGVGHRGYHVVITVGSRGRANFRAPYMCGMHGMRKFGPADDRPGPNPPPANTGGALRGEFPRGRVLTLSHVDKRRGFYNSHRVDSYAASRNRVSLTR